MSELTTAQREKLAADLRTVMSDAEALLAATASDARESVAALRSRAQDTLIRAKATLQDTQTVVRDKAKVAAKATDEYVQDNPWKAIGIAAGAGLILGLLFSRR